MRVNIAYDVPPRVKTCGLCDEQVGHILWIKPLFGKGPDVPVCLTCVGEMSPTRREERKAVSAPDNPWRL